MSYDDHRQAALFLTPCLKYTSIITIIPAPVTKRSNRPAAIRAVTIFKTTNREIQL